ncbi:MAG: hypothetical protein EB127_01880 [Alphaproteobacteria bacterium]|nr:hypothetical protein [Alphaproteobacteria bacterium]
MANTVYDSVEIKLSNGDDVIIKPLSIKNLRKFMTIIEKLGSDDIKSENDAMEVFIEAGILCMQQFKPELAEDREKFEDIIEVPTLMKILEVAGGMKLNDPNPLATGLDGLI